MKMRFVSICLVAVSAALAIAALNPAADGYAAAATAIHEAIAVIHPASGSTCHGTVKFVQEGHAIKVTADLEGLTPSGKHGFHIHEFGDCSAADAASAGSHFDPMGTMHHGKPGDTMKHLGDMGNIEADANGKAHYETTIHGATLMNGPAAIVGRGVIVHAKPDDFGQPVGNAGGRLGCGVIGIMKPFSK